MPLPGSPTPTPIVIEGSVSDVSQFYHAYYPPCFEGYPFAYDVYIKGPGSKTFTCAGKTVTGSLYVGFMDMNALRNYS